MQVPFLTVPCCISSHPALPYLTLPCFTVHHHNCLTVPCPCLCYLNLPCLVLYNFLRLLPFTHPFTSRSSQYFSSPLHFLSFLRYTFSHLLLLKSFLHHSPLHSISPPLTQASYLSGLVSLLPHVSNW
jgi:hypothetical protein